MAVFPLIRQGVLGEQCQLESNIFPTHVPGATALFSLIELAMSSSSIVPNGLGVAVGVISMLTLPVMLVAIVRCTS